MSCSFCGAFNKVGCHRPEGCLYDYSNNNTWSPPPTPPIKQDTPIKKDIPPSRNLPDTPLEDTLALTIGGALGFTLVGIVVAVGSAVISTVAWSGDQISNLSFAIKTEFNETLREAGLNPKYSIGVSLGDDEGMNPYIKKVYSNSIAERAGLEKGYEIIAVNGVNFRNMDKKYTAAKINSSFNKAGEVNITISIPNTGRWFAPDHRRNFYLEKPNKVEYKHSYQPQ